nr:immunoglobulin heavy chain junction region [Mus musculus]
CAREGREWSPFAYW